MDKRAPNALPIWLAGGGKADEYAEFCADFTAADGAGCDLLIAADSEYNVYLDGALIGFGQYQDYPGRLIYDTYRLTAPAGAHVLRIFAWHWGCASFTHTKRPAHIAFELRSAAGVTILSSSPATPSRPAPGYVPYKDHTITSQLGTMCEYSIPLADKMSRLPFSPSAPAEVGTPDGAFEFIPRPIERCIMLDDTPMTVSKRGFFRFTVDIGDIGAMLDKADTAAPRDCADGCFLVADTGAEETGFIKFLLISKKPCDLYISWGEHLSPVTGAPRAAIHSRRFVYRCAAPAGTSSRLESMRRVGCRYLALFCTDPDAEVLYLGLAPVRYPVRCAPVSLRPGADRRLYESAVRTLELCMHEHYEDCPWREQSLYTLDSRTQMRCGYLLFCDGNAAFARASLDLISRSRRPDGLLSLCAPAGIDRPIPSYSLAYILQMKEYAFFTGDYDFIRSKLPLLEGIMDVFRARLSPSGVLLRFPDADGYWNFYEWSESLDGSLSRYAPASDAPRGEAPLTALFALAASDMAALLTALSRVSDSSLSDRAAGYVSLAASLARALESEFFDRSAGLSAPSPTVRTRPSLFSPKRSVCLRVLRPMPISARLFPQLPTTVCPPAGLSSPPLLPPRPSAAMPSLFALRPAAIFPRGFSPISAAAVNLCSPAVPPLFGRP